jgi:hypothetical protein
LDREQAEQALGIIRNVIENTRDDLVTQNWGLILMTLAFVNATGIMCGTVIDQRDLQVIWYLVPLGIVALIDVAIAFVLVKRDQGVRSFIEWQYWGIWITFIVFTLAGLLVLHLRGQPSETFGPIFAMTSGIAFAMSGVIFYRKFLIFAALCLVVMFVACLLPSLQWWLIGAVWWCQNFIPGWAMFNERRRRQKEGYTRIL